MPNTLTCRQGSDSTLAGRSQINHPMHSLRQSSIAPPLVYIPSLAHQNDSSSIPTADVSVRVASSELAALPPSPSSSKETPSYLTVSPDSRSSLYTTIKLAGAAVNPGGPSHHSTSEMSPSTPRTVAPMESTGFAAGEEIEDPKVTRRLVRARTDPSTPSNKGFFRWEKESTYNNNNNTTTTTSSTSTSYPYRQKYSSLSRASSRSANGTRSTSQSLTCSRSSSIARTTSSANAQSPSYSLSRRSKDLHSTSRRTDRNLISLHRESCKLFESPSDQQREEDVHRRSSESHSKHSSNSPPSALHHNLKYKSSSRFGSPVTTSPPAGCQRVSPVYYSMKARDEDITPPPSTRQRHRYVYRCQSTSSMDEMSMSHYGTRHRFPREHYHHHHHQHHGLEHQESQSPTSTTPLPLPATVIDWTSPSTRRREYERIDRSSRGVRGLWRRFAPTWCQSRERRTLFYDEGKGPKKELDEGSVRRFRMDLPDD